MRFSVLTLHPELFVPFSQEGLLGKAVARRLLNVSALQIRDFSDPPHFRVDDKPYGGGAGMVLKVDPIVRALRSLEDKPYVVVLAAKGKRFTQKTALRWLKHKHIALVCGRYEGIDERVTKHYADEEVRIGDFVMMGGEAAAMAIIETVGRLVPGVLGNQASLSEESFSPEVQKEYDQYTRPQSFEGHEVPSVLLSGNHRSIASHRKDQK